MSIKVKPFNFMLTTLSFKIIMNDSAYLGVILHRNVLNNYRNGNSALPPLLYMIQGNDHNQTFFIREISVYHSDLDKITCDIANFRKIITETLKSKAVVLSNMTANITFFLKTPPKFSS